MKKSYIGDGVYVEFDGWSFVLTTQNGIEVTNRIVLEPEVLHALTEYVERVKRGARSENEASSHQPEEATE